MRLFRIVLFFADVPFFKIKFGLKIFEIDFVIEI